MPRRGHSCRRISSRCSMPKRQEAEKRSSSSGSRWPGVRPRGRTPLEVRCRTPTLRRDRAPHNARATRRDPDAAPGLQSPAPRPPRRASKSGRRETVKQRALSRTAPRAESAPASRRSANQCPPQVCGCASAAPGIPGECSVRPRDRRCRWREAIPDPGVQFRSPAGCRCPPGLPARDPRIRTEAHTRAAPDHPARCVPNPTPAAMY